jgi:hypothetical protein
MNIAEEFTHAIARGVEHAMHDTEREADRRSAGPYSSAELAAKDHPYAKRHGSPQLDPSIVNEQTGDFREHWKRSLTVIQKGDYDSRLINESEHADYLKNGNKFTFRRPIGEALEEYAAEEVPKRIEQQLSQLLKLEITYA